MESYWVAKFLRIGSKFTDHCFSLSDYWDYRPVTSQLSNKYLSLIHI